LILIVPGDDLDQLSLDRIVGLILEHGDHPVIRRIGSGIRVGDDILGLELARLGDDVADLFLTKFLTSMLHSWPHLAMTANLPSESPRLSNIDFGGMVPRPPAWARRPVLRDVSGRPCVGTGRPQAMASDGSVATSSRAKLARVAAREPSTSMARQASSITVTPKSSRRASSAE